MEPKKQNPGNQTNQEKWTDATREFAQRIDHYINQVVADMNSQADSEDEFVFAWAGDAFKRHLEVMSDPTGKYTHQQTPTCPIAIADGDKDRKILDCVRDDLFFLYDPCVAQRLWKASVFGDAEFLSDLANSIRSHIRIEKRTRGNATNHLISFLVELDRLAAFVFSPENAEILVEVKEGRRRTVTDDERVQILNTEYDRVFDVVIELLRQSPSIEGKILQRYFGSDNHAEHSRSKFRADCRTWFGESQVTASILHPAQDVLALSSRIFSGNNDDVPDGHERGTNEAKGKPMAEDVASNIEGTIQGLPRGVERTKKS